MTEKPDRENPSGDPSSEFQQILAHYHQSVAAQLQTAKNTLRTAILPALLASGVANVEAAYSGYGDSGAIDGVQYRDKAGVRVEREQIPAGREAGRKVKWRRAKTRGRHTAASTLS